MSSLLRRLLLAASTILSAAPALAEEPKAKVMFVGDSMSDGVGAAVQRAVGRDACLSRRIEVSRHAEIGTGLARADRFKWPERIGGMVDEARADLVVASFGLNDRTGVVDPAAGVRVEFGNPEWKARYSDQVAAFIRNAGKAPAGILWLGIPSQRDRKAHEDGIAKNELYRSVVASLEDEKVAFVEPWRAGTDPEDAFQSYWTDPAGAKVLIRAPDGIHFTGAGYDQIALHLTPRIVAHLEARLGADRLRCEG